MPTGMLKIGFFMYVAIEKTTIICKCNGFRLLELNISIRVYYYKTLISYISFCKYTHVYKYNHNVLTYIPTYIECI